MSTSKFVQPFHEVYGARDNKIKRKIFRILVRIRGSHSICKLLLSPYSNEWHAFYLCICQCSVIALLTAAMYCMYVAKKYYVVNVINAVILRVTSVVSFLPYISSKRDSNPSDRFWWIRKILYLYNFLTWKFVCVRELTYRLPCVEIFCKQYYSDMVITLLLNFYFAFNSYRIA